MQAGRIHRNGEWVEISTLKDEELTPKLKKYLEMRSQYNDDDVNGHQVLAKWCERSGLKDQAKAHWSAITELDPNNNEAHSALGHQRLGNQWVTETEIEEAKALQNRQLQAVKKWTPQINKIVQRLQSEDSATKLKAIAELETIDDQDAVYALQFAALQVDESIAMPLVDAILRFRSKQACAALCQIALKNPHSNVGLTAINGLKAYDEHFYVPDLLNMLQTPVEVKQHLFRLPTGELALQQLISTESQFQKNATVITKMVSMTGAVGSPKTRSVAGGGLSIGQNDELLIHEASNALVAAPLLPQATSSLEAVAAVDAYGTEVAKEQSNSVSDEKQRRVKLVLSAIPG